MKKIIIPSLQLILLVVLILMSVTSQAAGTLNSPIVIDIATVSNGTRDGYVAASNSVTIIENGHYLITGTSTAKQLVVNQSLNDLSIYFNNLHITNNLSNAMQINGNSQVKLILDGVNSLIATNIGSGMAGLFVNNAAHLIIYGPGELTAKGANSVQGSKNGSGAGIGSNGTGSNAFINPGAITIYGGTIIAMGGSNAASNTGTGAGIGGGGGASANGVGIVNPINIYGGHITATGGELIGNVGNGAGGGAGIGGGGAGKAGSFGGHNDGGIYIHGGTITATGGGSGSSTGTGGAGVGGGGATTNESRGLGRYFEEPSMIIISDNASVNDNGGESTVGNGEDIGDGGSIRVDGVFPTLKGINCGESTSVQISEGLTVTFKTNAAFLNAASISYQWYENSILSTMGGTLIYGATSREYSTPNTLPEGTYYYYCEVTAKNGTLTSIEYSCLKTVTIGTKDPCKGTMTWFGNESSDWNDPDNWCRGIVPTSCSDVIISANAPHYPVLTAADNAVCNTIHFEFGGEIAGTHYLTYNEASADMTLTGGRWYMVAPVFQNQYSGDYYIPEKYGAPTYRKNPRIFMQYYQMTNPQHGWKGSNASWSKPFNTVDELLDLASGQAVKIENAGSHTILFPSDSTSYAYYNSADKVTRMTGNIVRTGNKRFIYEPKANEDGEFTVKIPTFGFDQMIVGNPFMSHLDMQAFHAANEKYFRSSFYIWNANDNFEATIWNNGIVISTSSDEATIVSPMQSFVMNLTLAGKIANNIDVQFSPEMSITRPGGFTLRSADAVSDVVKLEVLRNGVRQSGLAICYQDGVDNRFNDQKDVETMLPVSVTDYVTLYALTDGKALSIHTMGDVTNPVNLGISIGTDLKTDITKGKREMYSIRLAGQATQLNGEELYLYDAQNDIMHSLEIPYDFVYDEAADLTDRFQLRAGNDYFTTGTKDGTTNDKMILIFNQNGEINVKSTSIDPIREVSVFNLLGQKVYEKTNLNTSEHTFRFSETQQTIIVKVRTENGIKTEKIARL